MSDDRFDSVLVYDGECAYCSVAARALERIERMGAVSWYDEDAQAFLAAQFEDVPFAMVLVDERQGTVYAGRAAAAELADRAGLPGIVSRLVRDNYEGIASIVGRASGRDRGADDYHDVYELTETGRERYEGLSAAAGRGPLPGA